MILPAILTLAALGFAARLATLPPYSVERRRQRGRALVLVGVALVAVGWWVLASAQAQGF